ncbi:MAG: S8 family serine peptidase [Lachnospiraceae bacterium]|nr:S8 family serine peptidase [Lachnospiraceae bacterium]
MRINKRMRKIFIAFLAASVISVSTVPVGAVNINTGQDDTGSLIREEYIKGEAVICIRGSEREISEVTEQAAGGNSAVQNESKFLMDVSDAEDLILQEIPDAGGDIEEAAGNAKDSSVVLKLVRSDTLSTEELIELYSKKPEVLFAEPNYVYEPETTVPEDEDISPENSGSVSENDMTVSENKSTVSENKSTVSENKSTVSENSGTISENITEEPASATLGTPDLTAGQYAYGSGEGGMDVPDWNDAVRVNATGVVAVLDTGVDYHHEDLEDVMWDKGLDYPALTALGGGKYGINAGYDYYNGVYENKKDDPMDFFGHGTHCAGVIAAEWNDIGISGGANGAKIMALRHIVDDYGGSCSATSIMGFNYILTAKKAGVDVVAVNCSFGGAANARSLACCVEELGENGIVTCAASGNEGENTDTGSNSPSMFTGISQLISVNSNDGAGKSSGFSNYGIRTTHLYAPGTAIVSTYPTDLASAYPDKTISEPVKVSGKDVAVTFNHDPSSDDSPLKFDLHPGTITFGEGEMRIKNPEKVDRPYNNYLGKAFSVSVNLPKPEEGRHYYLVFSKKIVGSDFIWCFPVMANKRDGTTGVLGSELSNTFKDDPYSYEAFMIDEERFNIEDLRLDFYLYNPIVDQISDGFSAAIGEMWITDAAYPYAFEDGTSMATPAVAAQAAILAKAFPNDSAEKRAARILAGVKKDEDLKDRCITGGIANVGNSLNESKYTPVVNSIRADEDKIYIDGYFFGQSPDVTIKQGGNAWDSLSNLTVTNNDDGSGEITVSFPGNEMIRGEEVNVTVTNSGKTFARYLPLIDTRAKKTKDPNLYERIPLTDAAKKALSPAILINAVCLNGSVYYVYDSELVNERSSLRYQNGTFTETEDPVVCTGHIAKWNGMLVYSDSNSPGNIIFHDGNRIVKTKGFVPDGSEVPVSDGLKAVLDPPGEADRRFDLYYDGKDFILVRGMMIMNEKGEPTASISAVYRMDPYSCKGTFLGALKNVYDGVVITHEEKAGVPNTIYIIGRGADEDENEKEFVGEKFTVSPSFNSEVINTAAPRDIRFNPYEHWSGCGVKGGIFLVGAHNVSDSGNIRFIEADNYFYDYSNPEAGFQKRTEKISDVTVYHPMVTAYDNKVTFLTMDKDGFIMCTTDKETLPAYGEAIVCSHPRTGIRNVIPATCTKQGYSGETYCTECGHTVALGKATPIDPDNHSYDYKNGKVTKEATRYSYGEHTYCCIYNNAHTITVKDIPLLPSDDDTDYSDLADDTKDLSGNAAPVIEEGKDDRGNDTETVKIGGEEVSKKVKDPESGKEVIESKVWIAGLEKTYVYTGSAIKPAIHLYDGTRKLIENTDYTLSFKNNKEVGANAEIIVKFKGSYSSSGSKTASFEIIKAELGKDIIAYDTGTSNEKKYKKAVPSLAWAATGKTVSSKYFEFDYGDAAGGESIVTVTPKSNYSDRFDGKTTAKVKIIKDNNLLISNAKAAFDPKSYAYTGKEIVPAYTVTIGKEKLVKGTDYTETLYNNINPGKATVLIQAKPGNSKGYVGSRTASFKITGTRAINDNADITFDVSKSVPYAKGGAKASVVVKDGTKTLKEGRDYTLSYSKNKAVTTGETAEVKIKGKGSYKGSVTMKYAVTKQKLSALEGNMIIADQFTTKDKLKKPSVTITDLNGKKLSGSKDYTVGKPDDSDPGNTAESGVVRVTISAKEGGAYEGTVNASFRYMKPEANIGKAVVIKKIDDQTYTGYAVKLSNDDLKGVLKTGSKTLEPGKDFIIDKRSYRNNNKKGTAKVTVIGTGTAAGRKTISFKITARPVDYKGTLW